MIISLSLHLSLAQSSQSLLSLSLSIVHDLSISYLISLPIFLPVCGSLSRCQPSLSLSPSVCLSICHDSLYPSAYLSPPPSNLSLGVVSRLQICLYPSAISLSSVATRQHSPPLPPLHSYLSSPVCNVSYSQTMGNFVAAPSRCRSPPLSSLPAFFCFALC